MTYIIDRFGDAYATAEVLPGLDGRQPQGAGPVQSSDVSLIGGGHFDWRGSETALPPTETARIRGEWIGTSLANMKTKLATLRALRGVKSYLWRTSGSSNQWRRARYISVDSDLGPSSAQVAVLELQFELNGEPWHSTSGYTSVTLAASPQNATIANNGNAVVREITLSVHPATSAITAIHVENLTTGHVSKIKYAGTIASTQALVINCAAKSVENNSTDDYANFSLEGAHTISEWLRLAPGDNSIRITRTGGAATSTVGLTFYEAHA